MVENQKIFCVKFADDVAIVADHEEGLREMMAELEIYCDKNDLEVNTEKSKIIKFRKEGKREKKQEWFFKGRKLEKVEKIKYLGYIFTSTNSQREHIKSPTNKAKRIIKIVWGFDEKGEN